MTSFREDRVFVPLHVPKERRLQTAAVLLHLASIPFFLSLPFILAYLALTCVNQTFLLLLRFFIATYAVYYVIDFKRPFSGESKPSAWLMKYCKYWFKLYRAYYPVTGAVSEEAAKAFSSLEGSPRPFMIGSHPHGIVSVGSVTNFALDPGWLIDRFPHINLRLLTLNMNLIWPFWRDWLLGLGFASVDKVSCENILRKSGRDGKSNGLAIVLGGAREALDAAPGKMDLTLNCRNGFFKLALEHGALLFPAIVFGENDIYEQINNGFVRSVQQAWYKVFGFSTPFFFGRGIFNYRFGWLPRRIPITMVIGDPIDVQRKACAEITGEDISKLRSLYIERLAEIYEEYRDEYEVVRCAKGLRILQ